MENAEIMYGGFYHLIMQYMDVYKPSVEHTMNFVGAILFSIIDMTEMSLYERSFYLEIYKKLIVKRLNEKQLNEEKIQLVK